MGATELLTGSLLILESFLAMACFLAAVVVRVRRGRWSQRESWQLGERYINDLRNLAAVKPTKRSEQIAKIQNLKERVRRHRDEGPLLAVLDHVLNVPPGMVSLETVVGQQLSQEDRGQVGLCTLLTRAAPLTGLAGMLTGVARALSMYLASHSSPEVFISGFAGSIKATFCGVMIAVLALFTSRRLLLPHLECVHARLVEQATSAMVSLAALRRRRPPEGGPACLKRSQPSPNPLSPAAIDAALTSKRDSPSSSPRKVPQ
jgi:biopolymer transport protein ExbB/TolQ